VTASAPSKEPATRRRIWSRRIPLRHRHRHLLGLLILVSGVGLGAAATVLVYGYGEQQGERLLRIGIPGAMLLALAIGALIVWGRSLENGPD